MTNDKVNAREAQSGIHWKWVLASLFVADFLAVNSLLHGTQLEIRLSAFVYILGWPLWAMSDLSQMGEYSAAWFLLVVLLVGLYFLRPNGRNLLMSCIGAILWSLTGAFELAMLG